MKFGQSFKYNGYSTEDFNLIICSDNPASEYALSMDREIITGNTTHVRNEAFGLSAKYSNMLSLELMLIKNPRLYTAPELLSFSRDELRNITAWLTSPTIPMLLDFTEYDESQDPVDFFGNFDSVNTFTYGNIYGIKATFLCNAPWGYTKELEYSSDISGSGIINIDNTSDDWESAVYPLINIHPTENGNITITNITENKSFSFLAERNLDIMIDCRRLMVTKMVTDTIDIVSFRELGWTTDTLDTLYWPRLIHGENQIQITGNCTIKISCRFPRKVGET